MFLKVYENGKVYSNTKSEKVELAAKNDMIDDDYIS